MASDKAAVAATATAETAAEGGAKRPGLFTLVKAVAFVSVVVLVEIVGASMLIPSAKDVQAIGAQLASAGAAGDVAAVDERQVDSTLLADTREVALGSYHVLTFDPQSGSSVNIDFDLFGTVLANEESEFFRLYELNQNRISEQVTVTMRGLEVTDFTDADLDLIKRKLLEKTNRALGKPLLHSAVIPKFSFIER
ncbi:MAG: hypothetical protein KDA44_03905 [Planctomycetales bacterium]|nr:hypothetical protein [Planctomycetales bacterium]